MVRLGILIFGMILICVLILTSTVQGNVDPHNAADQDDVYFDYYPLYTDDEDFGRSSIIVQMSSGDYELDGKSMYFNDGNLPGRGAIDPREIGDYGPDYQYIVGKTLLDILDKSEADENYTMPIFEWETPTEKPKMIENFEGQSVLLSHRPDFYWTGLSDDDDEVTENTTEKPSLVSFEGNLTIVATLNLADKLLLDDVKENTTEKKGERLGSAGEVSVKTDKNATSSPTALRASSDDHPNTGNITEVRSADEKDSNDSSTSTHAINDTSGRTGVSTGNFGGDKSTATHGNSTEERAADVDNDADVQNNVTNVRKAVDKSESVLTTSANATEQRTSVHDELGPIGKDETSGGSVGNHNATWRANNGHGESSATANGNTTEGRSADKPVVTESSNSTDLRANVNDEAGESLQVNNNATDQRTVDDDDASLANVTQASSGMDGRSAKSNNATRASSDDSSDFDAINNGNTTHVASSSSTDQRVADEQIAPELPVEQGTNVTEERSVDIVPTKIYGSHITAMREQEGQVGGEFAEKLNGDVANVPHATTAYMDHDGDAEGVDSGFATVVPAVYDEGDADLYETTTETHHIKIDDEILPIGRNSVRNRTAESFNEVVTTATSEGGHPRADNDKDSVVEASNETMPINHVVGVLGGRSFHNFAIGQDEFNRCKVVPYPCAIGDVCKWNGRRVTCVPRLIPSDLCQGHVCQNGGICYSDNGQFRCDCPVGFSGRYCEIVGGACHPNPCFGNCKCVESCRHELGYYCQSHDGQFTGKNCTIPAPRLLCDPNEMKLILSPRYVQDFGIQRSMNSLVYASPDALGSHQRSPGCEAFLDASNLEIVIPLPFNQCGTAADPAIDGSGEQVFRNRLWIDRRGPGFDMPVPIVDFECTYKKEYRFATSLKPVFDSPETYQNTGQIPINLQLCKVSACPSSCPKQYSVEGGAAYTVGELIHLRASTASLPSPDVVMSVEELIFSCDRERTTSPFHVIQSGCAANPGMHVRSSAGSHACITFQTPRAKNCPTVYLHVHVRFCLSHELTFCGTGVHRCPSGLGRRKRSVGMLESASVIGPLKIFEGAQGRGGVDMFPKYNPRIIEPVKVEKVDDESSYIDIKRASKSVVNGSKKGTILYAAVSTCCFISILVMVSVYCLTRKPKKSRPIVSIT